ncbi:hypothetical protein INT48_006408 [Thamnidium elegans]|uniref:VTC domain-containing protein n=1 Tax=Thamnidium elegans TaxID=101142 RepID=A0A8H7SNB1_9FUNG|nr:hypothetical protein INT48_006408 [Thamnidium elegans]
MLSEKTIDQMPLPWLPLPITQSSLSDVARQRYDGPSFDQEWKDLRFIPWQFFYLDYHHLQQDIVYGNIVKRLETEWNKVYEFYILKRGEIERRIESTRTTRNEQELKTLVIDIHQLYHFAKLNYCGFLRLFMQYDRLFGSNTAKNMSFRKKKQVHPLSNSNSSCTLSTMSSCETALSTQLGLPKHEKTIKKYWVHPDNIVEVMLFMSTNKMVLQDQSNNPSSTYTAVDEVGHPQGIKSKLAAKSTQSIHHIEANPAKEPTGRLKVTTTYMDTVDLNDYTDRIICKPIKTTRVREFETINSKEEKDTYISVEQKVYYNGQQNHTYKGYKGFGKEPQQNYDPSEQHDWIQQRVWLKSKHVEQWINGDYSISNVLNKPSCQYRTDGLPTITTRDKNRMENTCLQMQNELHNQIKTPILKTTQYRTVYTSNKVTVSIDTDISISSGKELIRFPYCIVQVEQSSQPEPDWIRTFTCNAMLEPVHDFSLYLHGVGTLLDDRVHVFPSWFSKMEILDIRHTEYRGSLLFVEEEKATSEIQILLLLSLLATKMK